MKWSHDTNVFPKCFFETTIMHIGSSGRWKISGTDEHLLIILGNSSNLQLTMAHVGRPKRHLKSGKSGKSVGDAHTRWNRDQPQKYLLIRSGRRLRPYFPFLFVLVVFSYLRCQKNITTPTGKTCCPFKWPFSEPHMKKEIRCFVTRVTNLHLKVRKSIQKRRPFFLI